VAALEVGPRRLVVLNENTFARNAQGR
jgi:hypothetical protein